MDFVLEEKIKKLSKECNYSDSKTALKIISSLTSKEAEIVLGDPSVIHTILHIKDVDLLKTIFRNSPVFFQEIMFSDIKVQNLLLTPRKYLTAERLEKEYNGRNFYFSDKEIRNLEVFLGTIKSPKVFDQLIENKFFQRILMCCNAKSVSQKMFRHIDEVKLFNNIISDSEIFDTKPSRKKNILELFNKISDHVLLSDDYSSFISDGIKLIQLSRWNSKRVIIDQRTLSLLTTPMLAQLLEFPGIDLNFIKSFLKEDITSKITSSKNDFKTLFSHLFTEYNWFNGIDYLYFSFITDLMEQDLEIKTQFLDFLYDILCRDYAFDEKNQEMMKQTLFLKMRNHNIMQEDYRILFRTPSAFKTVFYLKFNQIFYWMNSFHGISSEQLLSLNVKHINQILGHLKIENEDELSNLYAYAIKVYMVFGLERTNKILDGDYGKVDHHFFDQISKLDVSNVMFHQEGKKYIPVLNQEFLNFLFFREDQNHFREMLSSDNSLLLNNFSYFYNHYGEIKERCHGNITLRKLHIILKEMSSERDINDISPNNYRLEENDILNDICLGNKTGKSNSQIYKKVLDIYDEMKHRVESSIPYVEGESSNGYFYQMMKLQDPIAFTLGYKGNCCIRVSDIGHRHLLHATLCRNGRILLIYDENHKLAAFSPLKRNGEVLIANSIECLHKRKNEETIPAFLDAICDIVSISKTREEEPIRLVCIGDEAYTKPDGPLFPKTIKTPTIFEKNDSIYGDTDCYHKTLDIVYQDPSLDLEKIKYKNPEYSYMDPRNEIRIVDYQTASKEEVEESLKVINAIRYENANLEELDKFSLCNSYQLRQSIYNDDWYLAIGYDGNVYGECLKTDSRALEEQRNAFLEIIGTDYDDYTKEHGYLKKIESRYYF